jgi:hypothetical protein
MEIQPVGIVMFWSKRIVFFSYRDGDPNDKARAEKLAQHLKKLNLKPILEVDKKRPGEDFPTALFDQLSQSDAVVSILSNSALQSQWIFFEALTAKLQNKWFPVVFDNVKMPEELSSTFRTFMTDEQLDKGNDPGIVSLANSISERASAAKRYYGVTQPQARRKAISLVAAAGFLFAAVTALASLLSNLHNIRTDLCANAHFSEICTRAGWPANEQVTHRS